MRHTYICIRSFLVIFWGKTLLVIQSDWDLRLAHRPRCIPLTNKKKNIVTFERPTGCPHLLHSKPNNEILLPLSLFTYAFLWWQRYTWNWSNSYAKRYSTVTFDIYYKKLLDRSSRDILGIIQYITVLISHELPKMPIYLDDYIDNTMMSKDTWGF